MFIPKKYGYGKIDICPFCKKNAIILNQQKIPVCSSHAKEKLVDLKCACGSILEIMQGKYGVFFSCLKCGNMNLRKVMEINTINPMTQDPDKKSNPQPKKVITIRSDDPRYFD